MDARWLQYIFGLSLANKANPDAAEPAPGISPEDALGLMTRIFTHCGALLLPFMDQQVAEGLIHLGSAGESDWMYFVYDPAIDRQVRYDCIRSIEVVYRDCFARRCPNTTTRHSSGAGSLNTFCYMWWDLFPSGGVVAKTKEELQAVDNELIEVMAKALQLEHAACQESALHGLGHWQGANANRVRATIDQWLGKHPQLSSALREYAEAARTGNVQ